MDRSLYWYPGNLILPLGSNLFRIFQPISRRNFVCDLQLVKLSSSLVNGISEKKLKSETQNIKLIDATCFNLLEHPYKNPDMYLYHHKDLDSVEFEDAVAELVDAQVIVESIPCKLKLEKDSLGARYRGNFYEQVGTECLYRRELPEVWWKKQKFTDDLLGVRETPYRFIQEAFLNQYFKEKFKNKTVLEIGSGTGYYTNKISEVAKVAVGMDYNPNYIEAAKSRWNSNANEKLEFFVGNIIELEKGDIFFSDRKFDVVILIDTFLFLFDDKYQKQLSENRSKIVSNMKSLLTDGGEIVIVDPHPLWLTPWMGDENNPVGILTEYRNRRFKVVPSLGEISELFYYNDLNIRRIHELYMPDENENIDKVSSSFMREFPQWWVFELEKRKI